MTERRIITQFAPPPGPNPLLIAWVAWREGHGCCDVVGYGRTEQDSENDLRHAEAERDGDARSN
jgi:hypothetical protein